MWTAMIFVCVFVICTKFDWLVQECSKYIERCDVFTMLFLLIFQNSLEWVVRQGKCLFKFVLILILYKYKVCTQVKWLKISVYKWSFYAFLLPPLQNWAFKITTSICPYCVRPSVWFVSLSCMERYTNITWHKCSVHKGDVSHPTPMSPAWMSRSHFGY